MSKQAQRGILSPLALFLGAALVFGAAACSSDLASPAARTPRGTAGPEFGRSGGNGRSRLYSNRDRYRNRGRGHGYGRANDVDVEGLALLGADHVTRLTLSTGTVDPLAAGDGSITKVQVKAYSPQGAKLYVTNFNHLTPNAIQNLSLNGLGEGALLYIRVHVRGARTHQTNCGCRDNDRGRGHDDNRAGSRGRDRDDDRWERRGNGDDDDCDDDPRTDVVTLTEVVKAAPSLDVDINLPPGVVAGAPTLITGTVSEVNGDFGTRAECQLWVNGQLVDRATGIWVDAGDAVTCAFTHTFPLAGPQQVEVRVVTVGGPLFQSGTVSDGGTLDVGSAFTTGWDAQVEDRSVNTTSVYAYTWWKPDGSHKEYSNTEVNGQRSQTISAQGTWSRAAVFPITSVRWTVESNGGMWQDENWAALAATTDGQGRQCATRDMPENGAVFYLCNGLLGGASWGYQRFAGNVTYHSQGYSNLFDGLTGEQSLYSWNDGYTAYGSGGQVRNLGLAVQMRLTVTDAAGTAVFAPLVPLTPFSGNIGVTAEACQTTTSYELAGGSQTLCTSGRVDEVGWRGNAGG